MTPQYLHLLTNHFSVVGSLIALGLLLYAVPARHAALLRAAQVLLVVCAVFSVVAFQSGEAAEHFVEDLPGSSHKLVHVHEDAAKYANLFMQITGLLALGLLIYTRFVHMDARWPYYLLLLLTLQTVATMARTAQVGGQIRRPELREEAAKEAPKSDSEEKDKE